MEEEKRKLEKELDFLKESFDSEVISEEEYITGKERVERQLKGLKDKAESGREAEEMEIKETKLEEKHGGHKEAEDREIKEQLKEEAREEAKASKEEPDLILEGT